MQTNVFISSTVYDLIDMRAEIKDFLMLSQLNPIMSDQVDTSFITQRNTNSIETCLVNLRSCDVVIIILSQRYGPTLEGAGFDQISATHLEYLEAVKMNKHIILFVRDKLDAEYQIFRKSNNTSALSWIKERDTAIFNIIDHRKKLHNNTVNNWYWIFRDSLDVKKRLQIELGLAISSLRLKNLELSGQIPYCTISGKGEIIGSPGKYRIQLNVSNLGTQQAISPFVVIYKPSQYSVNSFRDMLKGSLGEYAIQIESLPPNSIGQVENFKIMKRLEKYDKENYHFDRFLVEVLYKTITGEIIADLNSIIVLKHEHKDLKIYSNFLNRSLRNEIHYKKILTKALNDLYSTR